jgi:hypothetical protein
MKPNEEPFESLARGLDKDLSSLFGTAESAASSRNLLAAIDPVFRRTGLSSIAPATRREASGYSNFDSLTDRFAQQLAVFPLTNRVIINEFGAYIPRSLLKDQTDIEHTDEHQGLAISISVHTTNEGHLETTAHYPLQQARRWIDIPKDDPLYSFGKDPVTLEITDASENLDKYIYGGE